MTLSIIVTSLHAGVQTTCLSPPLPVSALAETFDGPDPFNVLAIDFNGDDRVDFRLTYGCCGGIDARFDSPSRIIIARQSLDWTNRIIGAVGALPLGTVIGSNLDSSVDTNLYIWDAGITNRFDDETKPYGDHRSTAIAVLDPQTIGMPLVVAGDPADKEAVIAVEFLIGADKHYGYIHFDFRKEIGWYRGCGGYVLGWAYETEPNRPIVAAPVAVPPTPFRTAIQQRGSGVYDLSWRATPGATYRIQGAPVLEAPFTDFNPDIVPPNGADASPLMELITFYGMENVPTYFWRVVRTH